MSTNDKIIEQMLLEGTLTTQQSEYAIQLLREGSDVDVFEAIEKSKMAFSIQTQSDSTNETFYPDFLQDLGETLGATQVDTSVDSMETIEIDGLMNDEQAVTQDVDVTSNTVIDDHRPSRITPEALSRYTTTSATGSDSNVIGEGGMGRVVRVFDSHLGRNIARKELHHSLKRHQSRGGTSIQQRFLREARITAQLEHPGIVPVYEVGEDEDGALYYTMQELTGRTLKDALDDCNCFDERMQLIDHMIDFCQAIGFAHSKGIIHRDIKTENVMIDEHGQTIVLDWGLAKLISESEDIDTELVSNSTIGDRTRIGVVMGTPSYMSPEQAIGDIHQLNEATDVWSLGIVLFEIITGQRPFSDNNTTVLLQKIRLENVPSPVSIEPSASKSLCAIVEKALQKNPTERYQSAVLLAQDLQAWQQGGIVSVYEYSWQDKVEIWFVNNRSVALVSVLAMFLIMGAIVMGNISTLQKHKEVQLERDRAVQAEQSVRVSRVRSKLQAIESKIDKLESESSYLHAFALKRAYIDVKNNEYAKLSSLKDDTDLGLHKDIHDLHRLGTKVIPSKLIPYSNGEVYVIATNANSIVVGYSNNEIRSYNRETGVLNFSHQLRGRPVDIRWLSESELLVLDFERTDNINIHVFDASGDEQGTTRTLPFSNDDFDFSRQIAYHKASNSLILYSCEQVLSIQLDNDKRTTLLEVPKEHHPVLKLSKDQQYLAIVHRSSISILDLETQVDQVPVQFVHPEQNLENVYDESMISDVVWVDEDTILFRDFLHIWKFSLTERVGSSIYTMERRNSIKPQVWHLEGTDFIVTSTDFKKDRFVRLNWKTLESTFFTKESYNLPNRTQIQSLENGQWWGYSKENHVNLQDLSGNNQLVVYNFHGDIINVHHPEDGTLIVGNNTGDLEIFTYSDHIDSLYPTNFYSQNSDVAEFRSPNGTSIFRQGHIRDDWYYATTISHGTEGGGLKPSSLHLFNTSTKEHRTVRFSEEMYLCYVLDQQKNKEIGLIFSNPCDGSGAGGMITFAEEYEFGVASIPFPDDDIDVLDVDPMTFTYDLNGEILNSVRMFLKNELIYSDDDCVHFVNFNEDIPKPSVQCIGDNNASTDLGRQTPLNKVVHSQDENTIALYNQNGHFEIWDLETKVKQSYKSLDILKQLHCESASLLNDNHLKILCSNTLYSFDLNKDELLHTTSFVSDVNHVLSTQDGMTTLVTSKTKKRFWKINAQQKMDAYSLENAETFEVTSPDNRFVVTDSGRLFHLDTMTEVLSIGHHDTVKFSEDSTSMTVNQQNRFRKINLPDLSLEFITQQSREMHNLRVCYRSLEVVAVVPFPVDDSPWADPALCLNAK